MSNVVSQLTLMKYVTNVLFETDNQENSKDFWGTSGILNGNKCFYE